MRLIEICLIRLELTTVQHFLELLVVHGDGAIAYTSGDTTKLLEEAQIFQPHFMAGVPRVYNR